MSWRKVVRGCGRKFVGVQGGDVGLGIAFLGQIRKKADEGLY
ncbi:hypothetical protein [Dyella sp. C11]|nr:hypothetical protein [Dyella sp. C11]